MPSAPAPVQDPVSRGSLPAPATVVEVPAVCPVTGARAPQAAVDEIARASVDAPAVAANRPLRWTYMASGLMCVGMGGIGVVVPGLPTTIFLLVAVWCFARSCPVLEHWLMEHRVFGPYLRAVVNDRSMPLSAKVVSLALMWTAVTASVLMIGVHGTPLVISSVVVLLAAIGTGFICFAMKTTRRSPAG
ncbi:MAG: YbaN family protein [Phycisphaerales bacterium]